MDDTQLIALINERGALAVATMVRLPVMPALRDGMDLTRWHVLEASGALLFARVDADDRYTSEIRVLCLNAENDAAVCEKWEVIARESPEPTVLVLAPFAAPF